MEEEEEAAVASALRAPKRHRSVGDDGEHVPAVGGTGGEQETLDDLDLISRLPDEVLGTVVSLLPTKDGARTQVLSRRWLPLWCSPMAPLNLAADDFLSDHSTRVNVVSKILSDHPGPARHFSLDLMSGYRFRVKVARWFCSETLTGLEELKVSNWQTTYYPLPPCTLTRFAPTLRLLSLYKCRVLPSFALPSFPHLKQLIMYDVGISQDSLQCIISGCSVLENVSLQRVRFSRLCISSETLRSISLRVLRSKGGELVIEDAPCLERLLTNSSNDGPATIRVIRAPKLEILGFMSKAISTLHLGTTVFQNMCAVSLMTKMHAMKILALDISANHDAIVDFLKCFPCLEKLYVILHPQKDMHNVRKYDPLDPIECLELHLKEVILKNHDGTKRPPIDFAKFVILNAKALKQMKIQVPYDQSDEWMCYQRRQLQVDNRASPDAQIELITGMFEPICHFTDDFSKADPFE
ncbi:unnamed protein product [Alopecurus aequalis]